MGLLARILGGGNVVEAGFKLIDDIHTSDEEEIAAKSKAKTDLLTAYAPFKLAQRVIAFGFTGVFLFCFFLVLVCSLAGVGDVGTVRDIIKEFWIGEIMLTIVAFYFGGGAFEGVFKAKESK